MKKGVEVCNERPRALSISKTRAAALHLNMESIHNSSINEPPRLHYTDFIGAHSPFNTVHKRARGGSIEEVCGFLLTLQGPHRPTPARKQIKLQFHHLEGAVSCPKAALSLPPPPQPSTYTHKTLHLRLIRAAPLPRPQNASLSFHCSIAERNGGI